MPNTTGPSRSTRHRETAPRRNAPLKNRNHENFAQEITKGRTAVEAYRSIIGAGRSGEWQLASRWQARSDVRQRIADLIRDRVEMTSLAVMERRQILTHIARGESVVPTVRIRATVVEAKHAGEFMYR